jgi:enamine deaminase RidA (YjgF/YER057c/UK114 family)
MRQGRIDDGTAFEQNAAFSRAVVQEPFCFISGTTGYDYATMILPAAFDQQVTNCFRSIEKNLTRAGFKVEDIVRATYILANMDYADQFFEIVRTVFADVRPAIQLFEARLYQREMLVSIDIMACRAS